ncbi:MAG TPA: molybdenum cofactor guanylyltransferase, partial [Saprospiraceae bacterium]|nr:molybdenum cofactor guanylyltransferase [Saprospiraceae bacterium]
MPNALVLCGGQSSRLGQDKCLIHKKGKPLFQWWIEHLVPLCNRVYISCRADQIESIHHPYLLLDQNPDAGPMEGIYQAFQQDSETDWLVAACDLVYVETEDIEMLLQDDLKGMLARCYEISDSHEPFPLFALLSARAGSRLIQYYLDGQSSTRQFLKG